MCGLCISSLCPCGCYDVLLDRKWPRVTKNPPQALGESLFASPSFWKLLAFLGLWLLTLISDPSSCGLLCVHPKMPSLFSAETFGRDLGPMGIMQRDHVSQTIINHI